MHYTMGGVKIDAHGRVISANDEQVISGLYAVGEVSGGGGCTARTDWVGIVY